MTSPELTASEKREKRKRNSQYRYLQTLSTQVGLERDDRLVLADNLFGTSISSFTELETEQLELTIRVLQGHRLVQHLRLANGSLIDESEIVLQIMGNATAVSEEIPAPGDEESSEPVEPVEVSIPEIVIRPLGVDIPVNPTRRRPRLEAIRNLGFKAGMDAQDRVELARHLFEEQINLLTVNELPAELLDEMILVLKGHLIIQQLRLSNGSLIEDCEKIMSRLSESAGQAVNRMKETGSWD